jgi:sugar transferase (PEP-CTERM/EpsH1 system associated)
VLFLSHRLPFAPNRGDRIRAYHILKYLHSQVSVDVLSLVHDAEEASHVQDVPAERVTAVRTSPWRNRVRSGLALPTSTPLTHTLLDSPALAGAVAGLVRSRKPDVVLGFCSGISRLALGETLDSIPFVLDMVDVDSAKWRALGRASGVPMKWIYQREERCLRRFEAEIVARARTTLVINERERETLADLAPRADIRVIPNGIDVEAFRPVEGPAEGAGVVFCGVLNYQPNEVAALNLVQQIWPLVRASRPDARLTIVGAHPTPRLYQAASGDPSITITGSVPDVRPYLWRAAVSIAPLEVARGLQNKVLEALAAGLPVVTTPAVADGLPDVVMPACDVASGSREAATALLGILAVSPTERRAIARRAVLSELGWPRQLAGILPILTAAAERKPLIRLAS